MGWVATTLARVAASMAARGASLSDVTSMSSASSRTWGPRIADHLFGDADGHAHDDHVRLRGRLRRTQRRRHVADQHVVAEVLEEPLHRAPHAALSSDDGHGARLHVGRHLHPEERLPIAAREQDEPHHRLDDPHGQAERLGPTASIAQHLLLAGEVPEGRRVGAFHGRHLLDQAHAPGEQVEHLVIDFVEIGAQRLQGSFVGHGRLAVCHAGAVSYARAPGLATRWRPASVPIDPPHRRIS